MQADSARIPSWTILTLAAPSTPWPVRLHVLQTKSVERVPFEQQQQDLLTVMRDELLQAICGLVHRLR